MNDLTEEQLRQQIRRGMAASGFALTEPRGVAIETCGSFRLYFHRANPDGLPWCIAPDAGGWELAVRHIEIEAQSRTVYRPKATPDDEDGRPSAWIAVEGRLEVSADGHARVRAAAVGA